ncbi:hypothetical protein VCHENC02_2432A, partial [Vibrio harveyi]
MMSPAFNAKPFCSMPPKDSLNTVDELPKCFS